MRFLINDLKNKNMRLGWIVLVKKRKRGKKGDF
jgi:hypothetical protein